LSWSSRVVKSTEPSVGGLRVCVSSVCLHWYIFCVCAFEEEEKGGKGKRKTTEREGGREGWREERRDGGRKEGMEGGRKGGMQGGREGGMEGGMKKGKEG